MGIGLEIIFPLGALALGAALFYAARQRTLTRAEQARSDAAARANWGKEEIH
jgi:hypothetical protein